MSTITQWEGVFTHVDENGNKQQMFPEIKTDSTLTLGGKAADAAATGAMIKKAQTAANNAAATANDAKTIAEDAKKLAANGTGAQVTKMTQAKYDELPEEERNSGMYVITDGDELTAKNMFYDDTETQLGVNNVQDAIVEQSKNLSALGGFTPIIDETGKITGYKTSVGGADTVFPFKGDAPSFVTIISQYTDAQYASVLVCYHDENGIAGRQVQRSSTTTELIKVSLESDWCWHLTALKDVKGSYNLKAGESVSWGHGSSVAIALYKA